MQSRKQKIAKIDSNARQGFSIIELMMVMFIMLIMTAAFFASRNANKNQANADSAAREVAARIRQLQNESLSGKEVDKNGGGTTIYPNRFFFNANAGTATYSVKYMNAGGESSPSYSNALSAKQVGFAGSNVAFNFVSPRGEVAITSGASASGNSVQILLQTTDGSIKRYVCVLKTGNVLEQKVVCP